MTAAQAAFLALPEHEQRAYERLVARGLAEIIRRELALEDPAWNDHVSHLLPGAPFTTTERGQ